VRRKVEIRRANEVATVAVKGTFSHREHWDAVEAAVEESVRSGSVNVLFDFREAELVGDSGFSFLVRWVVTLKNDGKTGKLLVDRKRRWVAFLEDSRLIEAIETYTDEQEAIQSFQ